MITLAIETSTPEGSVAVLRDGEVLFSGKCCADRGHSSALFSVLQQALAETRQVDRIVVGLGPGSYSGVRVGIAAAIGLRYGLKASLLGIPSVNAIADGEYIAVHDARRGAFAFAHVRDGECIDGPRLIPAADIEVIPCHIPLYAPQSIAALPEAVIAFPCAVRLARLAEASRGIAATDRLEPLYLRDPHITAAKSVPGFGRA